MTGPLTGPEAIAMKEREGKAAANGGNAKSAADNHRPKWLVASQGEDVLVVRYGPWGLDIVTVPPGPLPERPRLTPEPSRIRWDW